ncbi:MAG: family 43 glycosylhydrolase [Prevotella sp.]|nr:family 43 glycosylhydrolase [Prevotella sp.]MCI2124329.1 family 43 glycosylhydrolase [Prevotella sp.]
MTILLSVFILNMKAQVGTPFIHDPSTIAYCNGKYYVFGTGEGGLISEDGWHWHGGAVRPGGGVAPDVMKIGDRYLVVYSVGGGGLAGGHASNVMTIWNKTLDPASPDFKYTEPVEVANSDYDEDCDAIDPSLLMAPDGRLWLSYGTYFGFIRLVELDPNTGKRMEGNKSVNIAIDCEATDLIYRNGWYYLLGTHGTCCDGPNSTYNIVVGRSKEVTGPYLDNVGRDMLKGGGKMVLSARKNKIGPGHFGRFVEEEGVEKMSCHYEADLHQGGYSALGILPLLWKNNWPVAGQQFQEGTYEIASERRGYSLELAVDFVRMEAGFRFWRKIDENTIKPIENQQLDEVENSWSKGNISVRTSDYMDRPNQRWTITAVNDSIGTLGAPYYKIQIAGTQRTLTATADRELTTEPSFSGKSEQLWQIDQLTDGTYRVMPKAIPGTRERLVLYSAGDSTPTLAPFDMKSDNSKWEFLEKE